MRQDLLNKLPQVGALSESSVARSLLDRARRPMVVSVLREVIEALRSEILGDCEIDEADLAPETVVAQAHERLDSVLLPTMRRAINATGVILHTGLGRAPLSPRAIEALLACTGATPLEIDIETGERGSRHAHCEALLCILTGAEAAIVVNNNAAACLLTLSALAGGKEVPVARGQLVEIGGSFRMPEVIERSGARLIDIGTSNRVYASDYERAITDSTGALLDVHTSNYRISGFTYQPSHEELAGVAHRHGLPLIFDAGSGALFDTSILGLPGEPSVPDAVAAGCDIVCFSGDKLLGGPQSGIIVGRRDLVERIARDPLARAVRVGKLTLAALQATLIDYIAAAPTSESLPTHARMAEDVASVEARARAFAGALADAPGATFEVVACTAQAGSGSLPEQEIKSFGVALRLETGSAMLLARRLREAAPAVFTRVCGNSVLFDLRTVEPNQAQELLSVVWNQLLSKER